MKVKIHYKNIFGMLFTLGSIFIIALFINFTLGFSLFLLLICFIIFAVISAILSVKGLKVDISVNGSSFNKGDSVILNLEITNNKYTFAIVNIKLIESEFLHQNGAETEFFGICCKNSPFSSSAIYIPSAFGKDIVGIESLVVSDFMSLVSISLDPKEYRKEIKTLPKLNNVFYKGEIVNSCLFSSDFDDSQELIITSREGSGNLGYEHRAYIEGDSPKKINWKLSAKKGELLVRLEEPTAISKQLIILNSLSGSRLDNERAVEALLAFADFLIKNRVCCQVFVNVNNRYEDLTLFSPQDIKRLLDLCANASFNEKDATNLNITTENFSSLMLFTSKIGENTLSNAENIGLKPYIITPQKDFNGDNVYRISAGLNIINTVREAAR